ncbi:MAG: hypothetical protein KTR29_20250, partial [Rhodothermaceae bacterium]|nr:hypothetical protein [Rhodothermaceae bacterium]
MQKIWSRLILETVLLAFLSTAGAYAQSPDIEIEWFNEAGGIELDGGGAVFQDRFGYMWFGTFSGLYKYDGYEFEIFVHDPNDSTSISGSWIETFYEDSRGDLWIGTYSDGINRFNRESNTFTRFEHDPKDETSISIGQISVLFEDRRGTFWVGSQKGLDQFDVESGTFSHYVHPTNDPSILKDSWIVSIVEDKVGRLWIGTENNKGVFRYDPQTGSFTHYTHNAEDPKSLYHNSVHYILQDSRGDIWITTAKGVLHRFDEATESFERFNLDPAESGGILRAQTDNFESWTDAAWATLHLFEAKQNPGHLWISSTIGLFRLNLTSHQLNFYNDGASSMPRLKNQQSWGFAEDDTGVIWATSTSGGAHKIRFKKTWLTHYTPGGTNRGLSQNQIGVLGENEDGTIRLHYSDYTYDLLDPAKGEIIERANLRERLKPYNLSSFREAFVVGTSILLVMEDQEWIYFNPTTDAQKQITVPDGFQLRSDPFEDRLGNIWFSCNDLCKYDSESGTIKSVYTFDDRQVSRILGEDSDGGIWFNTYTDDSIYLARYDVKKRTLSYYTTNGHRADWWVEDKNGDFWVGTFQGGLIKLKNEQEIEKVFGLDRGLPNYHVTGPLLDHEGYLWFGTASKLVRLDPNDETMTFLSLPGEFDGKPFSTAFNRTLVSSRGHFYIASLGRLLQISPDLFEPNSLVPPLVLTDLLIDNLSVDITGESPLSKPISLAENVRLSFEERDITLEFSVLDFENPEANTYSYKLENYDENWVQAGTRRTATYTNLDPGQYTFRVKGANSLGVWNEEGASIGITILPPWWRTVWAFVVYGLLFVVGIVGVNRFQRNRIVSRERLRAEREKAKAIEATNNELERALKHLTET